MKYKYIADFLCSRIESDPSFWISLYRTLIPQRISLVHFWSTRYSGTRCFLNKQFRSANTMRWRTMGESNETAISIFVRKNIKWIVDGTEGNYVMEQLCRWEEKHSG